MYTYCVFCLQIYFSACKRQKEIQQNDADNNDNFKILIPILIILNTFLHLFLTGAYLEIFDVSEIAFKF